MTYFSRLAADAQVARTPVNVCSALTPDLAHGDKGIRPASLIVRKLREAVGVSWLWGSLSVALLGAAMGKMTVTQAYAEDIARGVHAVYVGNYVEFGKTARTALALPYVSAFSFNIPWKLVEPSDGVYDWSRIDQALAAAVETHKKISVGLLVDWWAPDWVRARSASYSFRHQILGPLTSVVPWDPFYVAKLNEAVTAFGHRYNGNPALLFVVITGPATYWGTETNWAMIPGSISAADQNVLGFSMLKFENGWKQMIDAYFKAFSQTPLALALNDQVTAPNGSEPAAGLAAVKRIRDFALNMEARTKPGQKMWLELLGLSKGNDRHYTGPYKDEASVTPYEALIWDVRDKVHILYQDTVFMRPHNYTPEDVIADLDIGISFKADAIEIYCGDLFTLTGNKWEPYRDGIEKAHARMTKH